MAQPREAWVDRAGFPRLGSSLAAALCGVLARALRARGLATDADRVSGRPRPAPSPAAADGLVGRVIDMGVEDVTIDLVRGQHPLERHVLVGEHPLDSRDQLQALGTNFYSVADHRALGSPRSSRPNRGAFCRCSSFDMDPV